MTDFGFVGTSNPPEAIAPIAPVAAALGRRYFPGRTTAGSNILGTPLTARSLRMLPVTWPSGLTSDQWGIAYPANIYLLPTKIGRSGAGSYDAQWAAYWSAQIVAASTPMYGVPKVLPGGYTARRKRDWRFIGFGDITYPTGFNFVTGANGVNAIAYRQRSAAGYAWNQWIPDSVPYGYLGNGMAFGIQDAYSFIGAGIGYRALQYQLQRASGSTWTGNIAVTLSHNADGSLGTVGSVGGVTDYTHSVPFSDFSVVGGHFETAWVNAGAILPTLGVASWFKVRCDASGIVGVGGNFSIAFRLSPRMDVPMPFTSTSRGDVVAPGGTV